MPACTMCGAFEPIQVRLLVLPESTPATLFAFLEVFSAVGVAWAQLTGREAPARRMAVSIVAREALPFRSPVGPQISPDLSLAEATGAADIVVVTDLDLGRGPGDVTRWRDEADWLRSQSAAGATICSVCTGSMLLAASGLLDGWEATTHWAAAGMMRDAFPEVRLRSERVLCASGPGQRIVTGGGPGSWEDLALHLVARYCGAEEAVRISRIFVLGDRSRGQLLFSLLGQPRRHADAAVAAVQEWIATHYTEPSPVAGMVARSGLPARTFKRRFRAATGYTAVDYVQAVRIEEAKHLLEASTMPTAAVAFEVGYGDPSYFRRLFRRKTGVTPAAYRRHFARVLRLAPK